jgi:hypothetical protein
MTEQTAISFARGGRTGTVEGSWTAPNTSTHTGISLHSVKSIGYPIMAASVSDELETTTYTIEVPDVSIPPKTLVLLKSLPTTDELVSLLNAAILKAYSPATSLPQYVKHADGWYWENPTAQNVLLTFGNTHQQQLVLGRTLTSTSYTLTIPATGSAGVYFPDPRLGAVSQSLALHPGQSYRIELPLTGSYRTGILFRPVNEDVQLSQPVTTAEVYVSYPSIGSQGTTVASMRSQIRIVSVRAAN